MSDQDPFAAYKARWSGTPPASPEQRSTPLGAVRQLARGLAESGYQTVEGLSRLGGHIAKVPVLRNMPGLGVGELAGLNKMYTPEEIDADRQEMREFYGQPQGTAEKVAGVGGNVIGTAAQFLSPSTIAARAGVLPAVAQGGLRGLAARSALNTAVTAPLTTAQAVNPEGSTTQFLAEATDDPTLKRLASTAPGRVLGDLTTDLLAGGAVEGVVGGARGLRQIARDARGLPSAADLAGSRLVDDELMRGATGERPILPQRMVRGGTEAQSVGSRRAYTPEELTAPVPRPEPLGGTSARNVHQPEKIAGAAVRTDDGRVFSDAMHSFAREQAEAAGAAVSGVPLEEGFVTSAGRYVTREEARALADEAQQAQGMGLSGKTTLDAMDFPARERLEFQRGEVGQRAREAASGSGVPGLRPPSLAGVSEVGLLRADRELEKLAQDTERALRSNYAMGAIMNDRQGVVVGAESGFDDAVRSAAGEYRIEWLREYNEPAIAELYEANRPMRELLRRRFGDTVTLYRNEFRDTSRRVPDKPTTYYADRRFAETFGDASERELVAEPVPIERILHAGPASSGGGVEFLVANDARFIPGQGRGIGQEGFAVNPLQNTLARAGVGAAAGVALDAREGDDSVLDSALLGAGVGMVATNRAGREALWDRLVESRRSLIEAAHARAPETAEFFFTGARLPEGYRAERQSLRLKMAEADVVAREVADRVRAYPEAIDRLMADLADQGADRAGLERALDAGGAPDFRAAAEAVDDTHRLFAGLADEMFGLGLLTAESRAKYGGRYLPRYYTATDAAATGEQALRAPRKVRLDRGALGRTMARSDEISESARARLIPSFRYRAALGVQQEKKLVATEGFFQAVRGMDEVVDPAVRQARDDMLAAARGDSMEELRAAKQALAAAEAEALSRGWVKLPETRAMGSMAGMVVRDDVARDIGGARGIFAGIAPNAAFRWYEKLFKGWKFNRTVMNPATHARNAYGSQYLSWLGGGPVPFSPTSVASYRAVRTKQGPLWDEGRRMGLFGGDFVSGNLRDNLEAGLGGMSSAPDASVLGPRTLPGRALEKVTNHYSDIDRATRLAHYLHLKKKGVAAVAAADEARKWIPTYQDQSDATKVWSKVIPFFGYTAAAIPLIAEAAVKNPHKVLAAGAATWALGRLLYGEDIPEEVKPPNMQGGALRGALPKYVPNPVAAAAEKLSGEESGSRNYLDFSYIMPWGDLVDGPGGHGVLGVVPRFMNPVNNFIIRPIASFDANKDPLTGKEIMRRSMTPGEKAGVFADRMYKHAMPSLAPGLPGPIEGGWGWEKLRDAFTETPNQFTGDVRSRSSAVADAVFGIKNRPIDVRKEYGRRVREIDLEREDLRRRLGETMRDKSASPESKQDFREYYRKQQQRLRDEMGRLRRARAGVPELR